MRKQAGRRFRAIVLTTVTTVCGLTPQSMESCEPAQYLIPAALSLAWGELLATPITLLIIPILIHIAHDALALPGKLFPQRFARQPVSAADTKF